MTVNSLAELAMILVSGMLGSAHCIGMCGGIAATMSLGTRSFGAAVIRQLLWSSGRIVTYVFLGLMTTAFGVGILRKQSNAVSLQAAVAIVAGLLLITQGIHAIGWFKWRIRRREKPACVTRTVFAQFLKGGSSAGAFVAGLLTGFLPCGLVYSFLALSVSTGSVVWGTSVMLSFGLGTIPVMLATGSGFSLATIAQRQQLLKVAAMCVIATGIMTMIRGVTFAVMNSQQVAAKSCPLCVGSGSIEQ